MSQERVLQTLVSFGLTQRDSQLYLYLSKTGLQKGRDIANGLKITKQQLYRSLKTLESRGFVTATLERPARFCALPFEKVLDSFLKAKIEEVQHLKRNKDSILSDWASIVAIHEDNCSPPKFNVIEGRNCIFPKIQQMIQETTTRISAVVSVPGLIQANQFGLFDVAQEHPLKSRIQFRFLTGLSEHDEVALKPLLAQLINAKLNFEGRTPDSELALFPRMVIRDEAEILFFITPKTNTSMVGKSDACLWTNCKPLVQVFIGFFDQLWEHATDVKEVMAETEN